MERRLGVKATGLLSTQQIALGDCSTVEAGGMIIATGGISRQIPGTHVLHTLDDAVKLREAFGGAQHVGVIDAGFIGAEVASSARALEGWT